MTCQRTREQNLQDVRTPAGVAPLSLKFPQSWPLTWILGRVLFHADVFEFLILISREAKVRSVFRSVLAGGYCVPEVSDTAIGNGELETMEDQTDRGSCVLD
jgi:hypothetical protein